MKSAYRFVAPESQCPYLADQRWRLEYVEVVELTSQEYLALLNRGWRRFGYTLFRPVCSSCRACQPIRVPVERFVPNRSQKRVVKANRNEVTMVVGAPVIDDARVDLYARHHEYRTATRDWPAHEGRDVAASLFHFLDSPTVVQEWAFYLADELVGIMYIDPLPEGFSGIYFFHAPEHKERALGNYMCLSLIEEARRLKLPYVYLGYYVAGCISMEYKAAFKPNQVLGDDGAWHDFLT